MSDGFGGVGVARDVKGVGRGSNANFNETTSSMTSQAKQVSVIVERLVNQSDDLPGIPLSSLRIHSRTMGMIVRMITPFVQELWKRRVRTTSNPPRFLNRHPVEAAPRSNQTIHAAVEIGVDEAMLAEKLHNPRFAPI